MANPLWFDIKKFMPDGGEPQNVPGGPTPDDIRALYRHINFMIHLLWGIPYYSSDPTRATIHGRIDLLAGAMKANFENTSRMRPWPTDFGTTTALDNHLDDIIDAARAANSPTVVELYAEKAWDVNDRLNGILTECRNLKTYLSGEGLDICLPFIQLQDDNDEDRLVPVNEFAVHGPKLKDLTLLDLFICPVLTHEQRSAIVKFRNNGVLRPTAFGGRVLSNSPIEAESNGQGNNYCCKNGTCRTNAGTYCSYDTAGNCSAMSGTCP